MKMAERTIVIRLEMEVDVDVLEEWFAPTPLVRIGKFTFLVTVPCPKR
jgi:hypothetical protein